MGESLGERAARRSVSLYWREKLWLLVDALQLLAVLLAALQPSLPYGWNVWGRMTLVFLLDIPGLLRPIQASNDLGVYPLSAPGRALVLVLVLLLAIAAALVWPRAVYALELYERARELEMIKKKQELQRLRRGSQTRPSVTAMLALSMHAEFPSASQRTREVAKKLWDKAVVGFYYCLGKAARLRAALTLFLLPALLAVELPLIFCSDQADVCDSLGLLLVRVAAFLVLAALVWYCVCVLLRDVREGAVARQGRQQEEHLKQRELEYLLHINSAWMDKKVWLVSSFKGGLFRIYFRLWLLLLKTALLVSSAMLGISTSKSATGLGWLVYAGHKQDPAAAATAAAEAASGTLADAIAAEPLGDGARTAVAASLILLFCLFAVALPPFRCRSSNCVHVLLFSHLAGISCIGLAAAGPAARKSSFLLYSTQHRLLAVVHLVSFYLLLFIAAVCCCICLMPVESPLLQRCEALTGYKCSSSSTSTSTTAADGRGNLLSALRNLRLVARRAWARWTSRCGGGSSGGSSYNSWSGSSALEVGETEMREKDFCLQPFEAPWPTRPQHARFWLRVSPQLIERLAASSLLVERYGATQKQLLPVHLANAALRELVLLVAHHIGTVEQWQPCRRSRVQSRKKTEAEEEGPTLDQLLLEFWNPDLAARAAQEQQEKPLGHVEEQQQAEEQLESMKQGTDSSLWSSDSEATAAAAALPHALAFRQLERAAHLSAEFPNANLAELQELKTFVKAVEWTIAEVFEKMSAIRTAAAAESIWQNSAPPPLETQQLLHDFAKHLKRRKRQMVLLQPVKKRMLLKLLAIRFLTNTEKQRQRREQQRKEHLADLFGEESSILFFYPND